MNNSGSDPRFLNVVPDEQPPPGCMEIDGVAWCVEHAGVLLEGSDLLDTGGFPCCDMYEEIANPCRVVPLFIRVEET